MRLFCRENLENMIACLKTAGHIRIVTDYVDYFGQITELLEANRDKLRQIDFIKPVNARENEFVGTNYERKYISQGRPIWAIAVEKI